MLALGTLAACPERGGPPSPPAPPPAPVQPPPPKTPPPWQGRGPLEAGQVYVLAEGAGQVRDETEARAAGYTVVDLGDEWAPFIFSEQDPDGAAPKPQPYRQIFIELANDRVDPDVLYLRGDGPTKVIPSVPAGLTPRQREAYEEERQIRRQRDLARLAAQPVDNYLEPYGIPPTLSVLRKRVQQARARASCFAEVDSAALRAFGGSVSYQSLTVSKREFQQAEADAAWLAQELATLQQLAVTDAAAAAAFRGEAGSDEDALAAHPDKAPRVLRAREARLRLAAIRAAQKRLLCEGLIKPGDKFTEGLFDLVTHEALALFERKNDIFSWGILGGETTAALAAAPLTLEYETFLRVVTERLADAAGIIEDESMALLGKAARYRDETGQERAVHDLLGAYREAFVRALGVRSAEDVEALLDAVDGNALGTFKVAFQAPPKPPYYGPTMKLEAEIDRGDVWYDFPFDEAGKEVPQPRRRYPHLTLFVTWNQQRIPLARWRTTIGSWRSERHPDGNVYYKYKNSDVGPRIWKHIVVSPVWVPPDGTPPKDMLTRKKWSPVAKPETVVNTDVVGPGFQSAYGLVMAIHHQVTPGGGLFDNQIRTHGSVDYTSIARRYSHGCHRLVNIRAVRLFGFVLRHTPFERLGDQKLGIRKRFSHEGEVFEYALGSRGYYFRLKEPLKVEVLEGNLIGKLDKPITAFVRKPGVDYNQATRGDDGEEGGIDLGPAGGEVGQTLPAAGFPADPASADAPAAEARAPDAGVPVVAPPPVINPEQARALRGASKTRR